jgi:hypothetical protein
MVSSVRRRQLGPFAVRSTEILIAGPAPRPG